MPTDLLHPHEPLDRRRAEFSDAETEQCFRQWYHFAAVRQARLALLIAISLIALFLISDYYVLPSDTDLLHSIIIRSLIFIGGLVTVIIISSTQNTKRFDNALLLFQFFAITVLLFVFNYFKLDPNAAILTLVTISLGMYLFIPNRFIVAVKLGLYLALGFITLAMLTRRMDGDVLLQSVITIFSVNLIGATFCYRYQRLERRSFLKLMHERNTREALQHEIAQRNMLEEKLLHQAHTDELTGIHNRRHFLQLGRDEISRSLRYDRPLSLLLIDLDHFKMINDNFGHDIGDEVLCRFSRLCRETLREPDILGRLGGEEFAIIIPEESLQGAILTAERLRGAVENEFSNTPYRLTVSIGVTAMSESDTSISDLLKRADEMMYEAKHRGRNRVIARQLTLENQEQSLRQ